MMFFPTKARVALVVLSLWPFVALPMGVAQSSPSALDRLPAAERKLINIKVTGSKRYTEDAIAAASGLQMGSATTEDELKKASRRLGDTGAFSDVAYNYSYSSAGTKLEFHVTDTTDFVPVRFEDFVWFTDADLRIRIKDHVPLFNGEVPKFGRMADEVSDVLQAMLVEGAIPGHVDYQRVGKEDGPVEAIAYRVSDVLIRVGKIEFTGVGETELPALKAAAERYPPPREYSRSRLNQLVQQQLLPVYHARGYLKASFGDPQLKTAGMPNATSTPDTIEVGPRNQTVIDVTFPVTPGPQYKLKSLSWSGNREFPSDELQKMVHLAIGKPANTVLLNNDLKTVQILYSSRGYITAALKANAQFDDSDGVAMVVDVKEGFVYHMGDLEFRGIDNALTAKLRNAWKIRPGDVYNAGYLEEYLPAARKLLPPTLDWEVSSHVTANLHDKTVDVDLIYSVKAPK
jgi:outer membrane protein assembly factor BamA